ncbi:hypothetical protein ACFOY2_06420 [Nonomuraea purpurea]|uniref:Secreted protein n=1 Tax=Nonomuraea purpurea TaxID=1849276 RepID=A0ABV8G2F2_9ACTN
MLRSTIAALAMTGAALLLAAGPAAADQRLSKVACVPGMTDVLTTSVPMLGQLTVCGNPMGRPWGYPVSPWGYPVFRWGYPVW